MQKECKSCFCAIADKDVIGINKKLLGSKVKEFYCLDCLADYLGTTVETLLERIEEFKEEGCTLFK